MSSISKYLAPLWDRRDQSPRLRVLNELKKTQWLSARELESIQQARLRDLLTYAYEMVPYYRRLFDSESIVVDQIRNQSDLQRIPFLTKELIRTHEDGLISRAFSKDALTMAKTGGSTGESLRCFFDKKCEARRNAAAMRSDEWTGWQLGYEKGALWGNPPRINTIGKFLRNRLLERVFYLDTMQLDNRTMRTFAEAMQKRQCRYLFGHAHSLFVFATFCKSHEISLLVDGIVSTSMMLLHTERQIIEDTFKCKIQDRYGCEEVSLIGSECEEHSGMHLNVEHLLIEFIGRDGSPALPGEEGEIVATDLINFGMPLLRYRLGDYGVPSHRICPCGRGMPLMERVAGRMADFLRKKDGTLVAGVSLIERTLTKIVGIDQMQIVQNVTDTFLLRVVRGTGFAQESELALRCEMSKVFGEINIHFEYVNSIPQETNGKFRFSICNVK